MICFRALRDGICRRNFLLTVTPFAAAAIGYTTIREVAEIIASGEEAFRAYEKARPPSKAKVVGKFTDVGVVRITMHIFSEDLLREDLRPQIPDTKELMETARTSWQGFEPYRKLFK